LILSLKKAWGERVSFSFSIYSRKADVVFSRRREREGRTETKKGNLLRIARWRERDIGKRK
jgi:hypothetical protein